MGRGSGRRRTGGARCRGAADRNARCRREHRRQTDRRPAHVPSFAYAARRQFSAHQLSNAVRRSAIVDRPRTDDRPTAGDRRSGGRQPGQGSQAAGRGRARSDFVPAAVFQSAVWGDWRTDHETARVPPARNVACGSRGPFHHHHDRPSPGRTSSRRRAASMPKSSSPRSTLSPVMVTATGRLVRLNATAERITGFSRAEVRDRSIFSALLAARGGDPLRGRA